MFAQIHLRGAEPEPNARTPPQAPRVTKHGHAAPTSAGIQTVGLPGCAGLPTSGLRTCWPSAARALRLPLYLAKLWPFFTAQLRGPMLRRLPCETLSRPPGLFLDEPFWIFFTSSFLHACALSAFPRRLYTQHRARTPSVHAPVYSLQAVGPHKHTLTAS